MHIIAYNTKFLVLSVLSFMYNPANNYPNPDDALKESMVLNCIVNIFRKITNKIFLFIDPSYIYSYIAIESNS